MNRDSIKKNYLYNISYQVFMAIVPLITTPYISRILEIDGIGIYSYTYSIVRYFWLFSVLGTATYGLRIIGISQEDLEERSYKFWNLFLLKAFLSTVGIFCYIFYTVKFADNRNIALIQGIYLLAAMIDISWFYQGMENFKKITIKNFIIKIMNVIFIFLFIKKKDDLILYTFGLAFFQFIGNFSMWWNLKKYIKKVKINKLNPFRYLKVCLELFFPSISAQIFSVIDKSMIGWITKDPIENGYYEQAMKIIDVSLVFITTLGTIMVPRVARNYKEGKKQDIESSLDQSLIFTYFLGFPMMFGIIGISEKFVPLFFGNGYEKSIIILGILSFLYIFMGINAITGTQYMISTGQQKKHTVFLFISGCVNIILNYILIKKYSSIGAAVASVIGEIALTVMEITYLYKTKQYNAFRSLRFAVSYILASLIMFVCIRFIIKDIHSLIGLMILIIFSFGIYIISLIVFRDKFVINQINNLKIKMKGK